jgi:hypothetical protein
MAAASRIPGRMGCGQKLTAACAATIDAHGMRDAIMPWAHHGHGCIAAVCILQWTSPPAPEGYAPAAEHRGAEID